MAIQDIEMDISLNVITESAASTKQKQKKIESFTTSIQRSKNQSLHKGIVLNKKTQRNDDRQRVGNKKRIKQKSLSTIFAKKLKETNVGTQNVQNQSKHSLLKKDAEIKLTETEQIKQPDIIKKKTLKWDRTVVDDVITNEPSISFTKPTQGYVGKTLLAKKRNISEGKQERSLSAIFSNRLQNQDESSLLNRNQESFINESNISNEQSKTMYKDMPITEHSQRLNLNKTKEKKHKIDRESDKTPKLTHKPGGKISSLFGNNPDIPNIGQRFVKPVNEPIFTEINFADLDIHPFMISNLEQNMCITKLTTIQQKAIPQIFSEKDILIRSQTGSGKTLTYALPIVELLHKIRPKLNRNSGLSALVVLPTRELVLQTYECFIKLVKPFTWIVPGYLIGGEKRKAEKARLRKGCNILIATPGRLLDHIKHTAALKLNEIKYFVLDEADRMLDMGYEKDISEIVSGLKISNSHSDESGYDPIKILKENFKKTTTDKEIDAQTKEISKKDDIDSCNKVSRNNIDNDKEKQVYHSSDDSGNEADDYTVPLKKKSRDAKQFSASTPKVESIPNTESDCKNTCQSRRQTILLSATLTQAVEKLAGLAMQNPIFIDAAKENIEMSGGDINEINEDLIVPQNVFQTYIVTPPKLRMVTLSAYIARRCQIGGQHKMLIFMATQDMVDFHMEILSSILTKPIDEDDEDSDSLIDVEFFKLHGNMTQKERTEIFKIFRQAKSGVLLCTDVAARGLDMPKVDCVVQYTGPISARDYVHRIGRTARAGCSGTATIFLTPPEIEFVRLLESRRIRIKQEDMNDVLDKLLGPFSKHNSVQAAATALQNDFENILLENQQLNKKACKAYTSWMRFYSSYPRDMREIFNRKELHLGHYAKSFALREPPQRIGEIGKKLREQEISKPKHNNRLSNNRKSFNRVPQKNQKDQHGSGKRTGLLKRVRMLNTSEYDSGLEPMKKPRK